MERRSLVDVLAFWRRRTRRRDHRLNTADVSQIYEQPFSDILHHPPVDEARALAEMAGYLQTLQDPTLPSVLDALRDKFASYPLALRVHAAIEFMSFKHAVAAGHEEDLKHLRELYESLSGKKLARLNEK